MVFSPGEQTPSPRSLSPSFRAMRSAAVRVPAALDQPDTLIVPTRPGTASVVPRLTEVPPLKRLKSDIGAARLRRGKPTTKASFGPISRGNMELLQSPHGRPQTLAAKRRLGSAKSLQFWAIPSPGKLNTPELSRSASSARLR